MARSTALYLLFTLVGPLMAQWDLPARLELDAGTPQGRQVTGLADPLHADAAVGLSALAHRRATTAVATGSTVLNATLVPAPDVLSPGMVVTIIPLEHNEDDPSLTLDGFAAYPITLRNGEGMKANTLRAAEPYHLLFEGDRFVLLGSGGDTCPAGYSTASARSCIADSSTAPMDFFAANLHCRAQGARLCTFGEWTAACQRLPGFFATVPSAEWVDHAANLQVTAKVLGHGENGSTPGAGAGCTFGGYGDPSTDSFRVRCCFDR